VVMEHVLPLTTLRGVAAPTHARVSYLSRAIPKGAGRMSCESEITLCEPTITPECYVIVEWLRVWHFPADSLTLGMELFSRRAGWSFVSP